MAHDLFALEGEHHDDREQQRDQRDRADLRNERFSYQSWPLAFTQHEPREHPGEERNAQVDEHALGDRPIVIRDRSTSPKFTPSSGGSTLMNSQA